MDLLDFEAQGLYFEEPDVTGVKEMIATAAENYGNGDAELSLLKAYFLAPESLNVLVALNRFYYYWNWLLSIKTKTQSFYYRSKMMFKELTDSLLTIVAVVAFIILAIYLLIQDPSLVGPI
jgi:hypothetical protein